MAKFNVWVDSVVSGTNVEAYDTFSADSSRVNGYAAGETVSAIKMNSILRQNSLVITALMTAFCNTTTVDLTSTVANVVTALKAGIASASDLATATTNANSALEIANTASSNVNKIMNGTLTVGNAAALNGVPASGWQKAISYGTAAPSGGNNGDIYIQIES